MSKAALQVVFALVPSTVLHYINFALGILLEILKEIPEAHLAWPTKAKMQENLHLITRKHRGAKYLDGAFGFMDGLNLPLQASGDHNKQNANYNGWLHKHVISNIIVFLPEEPESKIKSPERLQWRVKLLSGECKPFKGVFLDCTCCLTLKMLWAALDL
ncbi:hypothetical protein RhiTH_009911 [Rhizoctonia solani]